MFLRRHILTKLLNDNNTYLALSNITAPERKHCSERLQGLQALKHKGRSGRSEIEKLASSHSQGCDEDNGG